MKDQLVEARKLLAHAQEYSIGHLSTDWHAEVTELLAQPIEPQGTFTCPICGKDTPHEHTGHEIAYTKAAARVANSLEACDWSGVPIGSKAIIKHAITVLRSAAPATADERPA